MTIVIVQKIHNKKSRNKITENDRINENLEMQNFRIAGLNTARNVFTLLTGSA